MSAALLIAWLAGPQGPICAHVFARDPVSGFVDAEAKDSARDISDALRKKRVCVVDSVAKAEVTFRVSRRMKRPTGAAVATGSGSTAVAIPLEEVVVQRTLSVGDYTKEIEGSSDWSWKGAAGNVADKIARWVDENRDQLMAKRGTPK